MYRIYDNHAEVLPYVRIKKIELTNFKGVEHGQIEFNCAKEYIPFNTKSDILGLYGQNGSGKSSLVEALNTVKYIIAGYQFGPEFAQYIDVAAAFAKISVEFDFQYESGTVASVVYEVKLESKSKDTTQHSNYLSMDDSEDSNQYLYISEEVVKTNLYADGSIGRMHPIVDTKNNLFCGESLVEYYFNKADAQLKEELTYIKRKTYEDSQSFVFCNAVSETLNLRNTEDNHSKYYEILAELNLYCESFLFVIGTRSSGLVRLRAGIPIYIPIWHKPLLLTDQTVIPSNTFKQVETAFEQINTVLDSIIPGLQLELNAIPTITEKGNEGMYVKIMSVRNTRRFPFKYESDGIIKIVSILADFIFAYNQGSATLIVDEFDSGVFEYLLGELLQIFEDSGKGQLIFTSHNLRPLEVLDKKFIRFTTSDPANRYYKLKNIGNTNNLRDVYLREVQLGNQDVEIYKRTKAFKIAKALKTAGGESRYAEK